MGNRHPSRMPWLFPVGARNGVRRPDDVLAATAGVCDSGRVPEQPAGAVDVADGGSLERKPGQLR